MPFTKYILHHQSILLSWMPLLIQQVYNNIQNKFITQIHFFKSNININVNVTHIFYLVTGNSMIIVLLKNIIVNVMKVVLFYLSKNSLVTLFFFIRNAFQCYISFFVMQYFFNLDDAMIEYYL